MAGTGPTGTGGVTVTATANMQKNTPIKGSNTKKPQVQALLHSPIDVKICHLVLVRVGAHTSPSPRPRHSLCGRERENKKTKAITITINGASVNPPERSLFPVWNTNADYE